MKDRHKHIINRRGIWKAVAALALAMVIFILPSAAGLAVGGPVDLSQAVSLTVHPSGGGDTEAFTDDIDGADIVIDLYKVADAQKVEGYDTYEFVANETYGALFNKSSVSIDNNDITNAEWKKLSQQAAAIALGTASGESAQTPVVKGAAIQSKISGLSSGLYLVIARGSTIGSNEYIETLDDGNIATIARSSSYEYTFEPELVAIPTKAAEDGVINTANTGEWLYDTEIYLKAGREIRKSSMEIVKTLDAYETKDPATFVFQVEGVLGTETYSNVFSIVFDEPGTKVISIDDLPVGMAMTVTEVYHGGNYRLTTNETETATIVANDIVQTAFTNTYDDTFEGGGSIENKFTYDSTIDPETGKAKGWQWIGVDDEGNEFTND